MAARSMWKGGVSIGMVTFPISVYKAADDRQGIKLNILHTCGRRISEKKHCPEHGEVTETVKGYEYAPGEYVQLSEADLDSIAIDSGKALAVEQFVPAGSIGFAKGDYYLGTDKLGAPAYSLMRQALADQGVEAVTRVSFRGREQLATIRPLDNVLVLTTHYWPDEIRGIEGIVPEVAPRPAAEVAMAQQLIAGMTSPFDPSAQVDAYTNALISLIADKKEGRPVVAPTAAPPASPMPDLMSVLAAELEARKPKKRGKAA